MSSNFDNQFFVAFDKALSGNVPGNHEPEIVTPIANDVRELSNIYDSLADYSECLAVEVDRYRRFLTRGVFSDLSECNRLLSRIAEEKVRYSETLQRVLKGFMKVGPSFAGEFLIQMDAFNFSDLRGEEIDPIDPDDGRKSHLKIVK
jgi:hypothetical protein